MPSSSPRSNADRLPRTSAPTCARLCSNVPSSPPFFHRDDEAGVLRIDFPGGTGTDRLEHIDWDQWFEKFEDSGLAFLYQQQKASGEDSTFFRLVRR